MSLLAGQAPGRVSPQKWLWSLLGGLALHAGAATLWLYQPSQPHSSQGAAAPVIMAITMLASPATPVTEQPIGPEQQQAQPPAAQKHASQNSQQQNTVLSPVVDNPTKVALDNIREPRTEPQPEPKPITEPQQNSDAAQQADSQGEASGTTAAEQSSAPLSFDAPTAEQASAMMEGALNQQQQAAEQSWQNQLQAHLEQRKRYPRKAQIRGQQGTPWVRFTVDRQGQVLSTTLYRSSGYDSLDNEVLGLVKRAQPLPIPPAELGDASLTVVVPVSFYRR